MEDWTGKLKAWTGKGKTWIGKLKARGQDNGRNPSFQRTQYQQIVISLIDR